MFVEVNGTRLFCEVSGRGAPLLLLHGNGENHHIFDTLARTLAGRYTLYAIDSRGHGQSAQTGTFSYDTMAEDVYAFAKALKLERPGLIGFSDGAILGLLLALRHGEDFGKMALLGVNLKPGDFTEESLQFIQETYEETKDPLFRLMLEEPDIELASLRAVQNPILLVAGEQDIFKPELYPCLAETLPHAELRIMEGHGHDSYLVGQALLSADLLRFFGAP